METDKFVNIVMGKANEYTLLTGRVPTVAYIPTKTELPLTSHIETKQNGDVVLCNTIKLIRSPFDSIFVDRVDNKPDTKESLPEVINNGDVTWEACEQLQYKINRLYSDTGYMLCLMSLGLDLYSCCTVSITTHATTKVFGDGFNVHRTINIVDIPTENISCKRVYALCELYHHMSNLYDSKRRFNDTK